MEYLPPQSRKAAEAREIQPITREPGRLREEPVRRKFMNTFFKGTAKGAWSSMVWDTFFPALRDTVEDALHNGLATMFGGTTSTYAGNRYRNRSSQISKHNPDRALGGFRREEHERISRDDKRQQNTGVVELSSRAEAQEVLEALNNTIEQYGVATLAEFYQMVQIPPDGPDFTFGWEDLGGATIAHSRGAYYLDLPRPIPLRS
jgi:hypothetical protein